MCLEMNKVNDIKNPDKTKSAKSQSVKKFYVPLVGTIENYLDRSPWNFYSWSHIDFGMIVFLLLSLMISIPEALVGPVIIDWWFIIILVLISGIVWEIIEFFLLIKWGWKPLERRNSIINAFWDLFFICVGGLIMWLIKWITMDFFSIRGSLFYIMGLALCLFVIIIYLVGFSITDKTINYNS